MSFVVWQMDLKRGIFIKTAFPKERKALNKNHRPKIPKRKMDMKKSNIINILAIKVEIPFEAKNGKTS